MPSFAIHPYPKPSLPIFHIVFSWQSISSRKFVHFLWQKMYYIINSQLDGHNI
jgi:hypothetical protein